MDSLFNNETQAPEPPASKKGLIIAGLIALIAAVIGITSLLDFNSASQYQGLIQQIESQTEQLQNDSIAR